MGSRVEPSPNPLQPDEKPPAGYQMQPLADDPDAHRQTTEAPMNNKAQEPLIGYWAWENTLRTHKMKMHVAKNADLALHVVIAIIANQVRYERNAIAMTV